MADRPLRRERKPIEWPPKKPGEGEAASGTPPPLPPAVPVPPKAVPPIPVASTT